jgi:hypothetical protein
MLPLNTHRDNRGSPMNLSRQMIVAGLAALSLTAGASPAMAKGGGDINNAVFSSLTVPTTQTPTTNSGGGGHGGNCCKFSGGVLLNGA